MFLSLMEHVGGPGTWLPRPIEATVAWTICLSCLSVSGYHWCRTTLFAPALAYLRDKMLQSATVKTILGSSRATKSATEEEILFFRISYLPLTTSSRNEKTSSTISVRMEQLCLMLTDSVGAGNFQASRWQELEDDELVLIFRYNNVCRRLASLIMRHFHERHGKIVVERGVIDCSNLADGIGLLHRLATLWPRLLELPSLGTFKAGAATIRSRVSYENEIDKTMTTVSSPGANECERDPPIFNFRISVILPAFGETGVVLTQKLEVTRQRCTDPLNVEIIIVDAGRCTDMEHMCESHGVHMDQKQTMQITEAVTTSTQKWGQASLLTFPDGGGRGPCLNYGARHATGQYLCFLHSDTTLPYEWDLKIVQALSSGVIRERRSNSCAFSFGIDTTPTGLDGGPYPPGIKAVERTANLRTHMYALPYGDQCLSIPHTIFDFVGGFPDQCLMEDYELISLLRQRTALIHNFQLDPEQLKIIGGDPALCSPRRWQKFGVPRVTALNSKFVNIYESGMTPDDLFRKYYGSDPPFRTSPRSPWEICMAKILRKGDQQTK